MSQIPEGATLVHNGILFDVYQKEVEQFDGNYKTFEWVKTYNVVKGMCVVDGKILVCQEEQPGVHRAHSLPGGRIDKGETPEEAISREIQEETGIVFGDITLFQRFKATVGALDGSRYFYICKNPLSFGEQKLDSGGEKITVSYISFEEFIDCILHDPYFVPDLGNHIIREYILPKKLDELQKLLGL